MDIFLDFFSVHLLVSVMTYALLVFIAGLFWRKLASAKTKQSSMKLFLIFLSMIIILACFDFIYTEHIHPYGTFGGAPDSGILTSYFTLSFANSSYIIEYSHGTPSERLALYLPAIVGFFILGFFAQAAISQGYLLSAIATAFYGFYAMRSMAYPKPMPLGPYFLFSFPAVMQATAASLIGSMCWLVGRQIIKSIKGRIPQAVG